MLFFFSLFVIIIFINWKEGESPVIKNFYLGMSRGKFEVVLGKLKDSQFNSDCKVLYKENQIELHCPVIFPCPDEEMVRGRFDTKNNLSSLDLNLRVFNLCLNPNRFHDDVVALEIFIEGFMSSYKISSYFDKIIRRFIQNNQLSGDKYKEFLEVENSYCLLDSSFYYPIQCINKINGIEIQLVENTISLRKTITLDEMNDAINALRSFRAEEEEKKKQETAKGMTFK